MFIPANSSQQGDGQPAEDAAGAGELESVFSCSMLPVEYYMEMVHSLSCIGIVDASPAQGPQPVLLKSLVFLTSSENLAGELLKAAMSSRTPCLAICRTDGHCKKLEIMLTEYIYEEQQRDGSTYYIPEMTVKSQNDEPKPKSKAKAKPVTKKRPKKNETAPGDGDEEAEAQGEEPEQKKPKTTKNKTKKKSVEDEGAASDGSGSSMAW